MLLTVAMLAILSGPEADAPVDAVSCLWKAVPPARREALVALPYEPVFERRLEKSQTIMNATEVEAVAARCGARGVERLPATGWAVSAAAQRRASEEALQSRYPAERLDAAFAPLRAKVETAALAQGTEEADINSFFAPFEAGFLSNLGGEPLAADRAALNRYVLARVEGELANLLWLQMAKWEALSEDEKVRLMTQDRPPGD